MPVRSLGTLTLDIVAKTSGFVRGMDAAERKSEKWRRQVKRQISDVSKTMAIGLTAGVAATTAALATMIQRSRTAIDEQAKMAQRLNTTSESLAVLKRATDRTGLSMRVIETAARTLEVNLGRASQGFAAQAVAVEKLGVTAEELYDLPLDERINKINAALIKNVPAWERTAVAADLFGTRGAAALQQLDPGTIAQASEEVRVFGLALTDIDAAKVENANDSFSRIGEGFNGLSQQLTIEIAPLLELVGDEFFEMAKDAGGASQLIVESMDNVIGAVAFVADAVDSVGRVFQFTADSAILGFTGVAAAAGESFADVLALADRIPGLDFTQEAADAQAYADEQAAIFAEAAKNIRDTMAEPLAGNALREGFAAARVEAQRLAEEAVAGRQRADADPSAGTAGTIKDLKEIKVLSKELEEPEWLIDLNNRQEAYNKLVKELRTDEERLQDQLQERLGIVDAITTLTKEQRESVVGRIADEALQEAPEFAGLAPEVGGAFGELNKIDDARAELNAWYDEQLELLDEYRAERSDLTAVWDEREAALKQEHEDNIAEIERARQLAGLAAAEETFGNLADLARTFAGEQSDAFKVLFAIEKGAAIARSIVAIQAGIAQAAAAPFPANLAAMATVAAQTASIVSTIQSTTIQGQAHDGLMSVPKTGTYLLERGERVTTAETSAKLDKTLDSVKSEGGMGGGIRIVNAFDSGEVVSGYLGSTDGERAVMNIVRRNQRTIRSLNR